jgi:ribonuclease VapC
MFVDASAIVAILTREPEADALSDRLERAFAPITSPIAIFEAALGICRKRHASVEEAAADVGAFLAVANIRPVPISLDDAQTALVAFSRYGKGRGHPAQLNMGDCFAYAIARNNGVELLFKGDDFGMTDIVAGTKTPQASQS